MHHNSYVEGGTHPKKTCRKLNVSFWDYLEDQLSGLNEILYLSDLIINKALDLSV